MSDNDTFTVVSVVGEEGSGKSSLLNYLAGCRKKEYVSSSFSFFVDCRFFFHLFSSPLLSHLVAMVITSVNLLICCMIAAICEAKIGESTC